MVEYLPRSAWDARPPEPGPGDLTVSRVEGVVLHWPGMGNRRLDSQAEVASALRGWQNYHMDDRGWSDIAYQAAVDQAGRAWTLRGLREQSGANGNNDVNERFGAVLLVVGTGEQPSPEMISTTREVVRDFRELYPAGTAIKPHSAVRPAGTDCPGDAVRALIESRAFEPGKPAKPQEECMFTLEQLATVIDQKLSKYVTADNRYDAQFESWRVAAEQYGAKLFAEGRTPQEVQQAVFQFLRPLWEKK